MNEKINKQQKIGRRLKQNQIKPRDYHPEELIKKLKAGEIPEEELHDFFSYW